jgi:hypothetical protein
VHCNSLPLSFFPDIYNEDWFFFAREAASRGLPRVGTARQLEYDPYATPERARREELGDLLAEGLFALFGDGRPDLSLDEQLHGATRAFWQRFIEARQEVLIETRTILERLANQYPHHDRLTAAHCALRAAERHLDDTITPDLCVDFLDAWRADLADWQSFSSGVNNVGSTRDAMDFLGLKAWTLVEFGDTTWNREADQVSSPNPVGVGSAT